MIIKVATDWITNLIEVQFEMKKVYIHLKEIKKLGSDNK